MPFGLSLPGRGALVRPDVLVTLARRAEALALTSPFATDHVVVRGRKRGPARRALR